MASMYNSRREEHKSPFGALESGQEVRFALRVPQSVGCRAPVLFLEKEGEPAEKHPLCFDGKKGMDDWFAVTLEAPEPGLYFYWFDLWVDFKKLYRGHGGRAVLSTEEGDKFPLVVYDPSYKTPESFHGSVMYQIFPDRFLEGDPDKQRQHSERIYRTDKQNEPYFWGGAKTYGSLTQDYFGGDFAGIQKRLPFLHSLGVEWVYLNPIFEAHSNHRYNTADYFKADPDLGSNEEFAALCQEAKEYGIKIILDGVFSHTGSDSLYFNKEGRYATVGAWHGLQSPYRDWFNFHSDGSYDSWWGFETLPSCDKENPEYRAFIAGEGGVIDHWLQLGASGFRLDVADELPDDFIAEIRQAVKRNGEDNLLIGEVWEDAALKEAYGVRRAYFLGQGLDGVMNYPFRAAILNYLQWSDAAAFQEAVQEICENYPAPALCACVTHLSTHDTERAITALVGEPANGRGRNWQSGRKLNPEQYHLGMLYMRLAFVMQFTLPGVPCVYYGDEIAMQGYSDPFNRGYYDWTSGETRLMELMVQLSALRKNCAALKRGELRFATAAGGVVVYHRVGDGETAAIAINCGRVPAMANLLGEEIHVPAMDFAIRATDCEFVKSYFAAEQPV